MKNNNKIKLVLIFILAVLIFFTGYIFYYKNRSASLNHVNDIESLPASSAIKTESISNQGTPESSTTTTPYLASIEITIQYPQFSNISSSTKFSDVKLMLNTELKSEAETSYKKRIEELDQALASLESFHKDKPLPLKYTLIDDRKIYSDKNYINDDTGIFSYATQSHTDMAGAHGTFFYTSDSYDIASGNKISLGDLLQRDYQNFLSQYLKNEVNSKSSNCLRCEDVSSLSDSAIKSITFDNFVLSKEGITFLFSAYDLGAYAETASGNELFIPKTSLKSFIKKDW